MKDRAASFALPAASSQPAHADYRLFWGKARPSAEAEVRSALWHPAAFHCLDVAAAAAALIKAGVCPPPPPWDTADAVLPLAALLALHDIGKFSRPFQAKAPAHWPGTLLGVRETGPDPGHGSVGFGLLQNVLYGDLDGLLVAIAEPSARDRLFGPVCGHHGRPVTPVAILPEIADAVCVSAARAFIAEMLTVLRPSPLPAPPDDDAALPWWLAGFAVLADWIGSAEAWFPYHEPDASRCAAADLAAYWAVAQGQAQAAVTAAGLAPCRVRQHVGLRELVGTDRLVDPSPVQALASTMPLADAGPVLVMVEDQTGSGKTEAGLLLAHRLMAAGRADGLFVALPTMATANAMYARLADAYRRLFADGAEPSLVLTHGGRLTHTGFQDSILRDAGVTDGGSLGTAEDETGSAQCAAWIADDRRRAFLASVGVGTIDQALLAVLPTRHAPLRLLGLHRRVLIVDEAHAYDSYMREELRRLVAFQAGLGGHTIVLSATLPAAQRLAFARDFPRPPRTKPPALMCADYPLITVLGTGHHAELPCEGRQGLARTVVVERVGSAEDAARAVAKAAARGQAVAWVRNAVADAEQAYAALAAMGVPATLFHARFAMGDRQCIEAAVMARFGRDSVDRAGVVVATQVLEQSLDLDFDLMVTDLAPVDLLIQRAGRVCRHDRGVRQAHLMVLSPEPVTAPASDWLGAALRRTGKVYPDHALLWRSARALFAAGGITAPGGVRALIEAAYDADQVPLGLAKRADRAEGKASADIAVARMNLLKWHEGYDPNAGAWASDVRTPTRLGEEGKRFRLSRWADGVLRPWCQAATGAQAWALSEVSLPPWVADGVPASRGALLRAEADARAGWGIWERELPIIPLKLLQRQWVGRVLKAGALRELRCSADYGVQIDG